MPLYRRYVDFRKKSVPRCADTVAPAQACVGLSTARDFATWLSEETGEKYRVPSRSELDEAMAQVARSDGYAWTGTCHEVRVARSRNAAQRGWAKVRKAFGKPKPVEYDLRCEGNYTLKLDGKGDNAEPRESASPNTLVVLVREGRAASPCIRCLRTCTPRQRRARRSWSTSTSWKWAVARATKACSRSSAR